MKHLIAYLCCSATCGCTYHLGDALPADGGQLSPDGAAELDQDCANSQQDEGEEQVDCGGLCGPCVWPFNRPPLSTLRASSKKAFARWHYFPISYENAAPGNDRYATEFLVPFGSYIGLGGAMRERPLPRPRRPEADWELRDMEHDVRLARELGLDGFFVNMFTASDEDGHITRWTNLMNAAGTVDRDFKIVPAFDMETLTAQGASDATIMDTLLQIVQRFKNDPAMIYLPDGRLLLGVIGGDRRPPTFYAALLQNLDTQQQVRAFLAFELFSGAPDKIAEYAPYAGAAGTFVPETPWNDVKTAERMDVARQQGALWIQAIETQRIRAVTNPVYVETANTLALRSSAEGAIRQSPDWLQVVSWNNHFAHDAIRPSTGKEWAYYDLVAYYVTWFKTGSPPTVRRDVLFYSHRIHPTSAVPTAQTQLFERSSGFPVSDDIELVGFLTAPGRIEIEVAGDLRTLQAPAGVTSFRIPLQAGRPRFRLVRDERPVIEFDSAFDIRTSVAYQDLLYRSGSSARSALASSRNCTAICSSEEADACLRCPAEPVWMAANTSLP